MMTRSTFYRQQVRLLVLLCSFFPVQHLAAAAKCDNLDSVSGLIGEWQTQDAQQSVIEIWRPQADQSLKGTSRTVRFDSATKPFEESLEIVKMSGEIFYLAKTPQNNLPVAFKLVECTDGRLKFENPKHDFPQVIDYQFSPDKLSVSVSSNTASGFSLNYALRAQVSGQAKNIILIVADGMGPAQVKAYRKFKDDPKTPWEEKLLLDPYLVGSLSTESIDPVENITDSAAAATALATGRSTVNAAVSVSAENTAFKTVMENAKLLGMSTGLVVTSEIVHATPAAFVSHHIDRENKAEIADQFFDNRINQQPIVDVMLGGGMRYFNRPERNLLKAFQQKGYQLATTSDQLARTKSNKVLGLFADEGLPKMWDRTSETPSLAQMTRTAIERLAKNPKGFILLVEASQIDWAAHDNDIVGVISEMQDLEEAFAVAAEFAKADGQTLVIATADHETGGLSIGAKNSGENFYYWDVNVIKSFTRTPAWIASMAQQSGDLVAAFQQASSLKLSNKEIKKLQKIKLKNWEKIRRGVSKIISKRSFTGWTTFGHTGVDVFLYALGPGSESLRGHADHTRIGRFIMRQLEN